MVRELVSIIMLSHNSAQFIENSIKSILAQTYKNWELLFVDDASNDDSIHRVMELKDKDHSFKISQIVYKKGDAANRNSALKDAQGRWIAFLDAGDIWEPTKLEKQVRFMEEHDYAFSYTMFNSIDGKGKKSDVMMGGPECVSHHDLRKCCWMGYLTVMYDSEKIGLMQVTGMENANDYALWLQVAEQADCHLLPECLASQMFAKGLLIRFLTSSKWMWRYETYRKIERLNPISAAFMTIRNLAYTAWKWGKYAKKVNTNVNLDLNVVTQKAQITQK